MRPLVIASAAWQSSQLMRVAQQNGDNMKALWTLLLTLFLSPACAMDMPPPADQVFKPSVTLVNVNHLNVHYEIAPHTSVYQGSLQFKVLSPNPVQLTATYPKAIHYKLDPNGQIKSVYSKNFTVALALKHPIKDQLKLQINYQGCHDRGLCYPPQTRTFTIDLSLAHNTVFHPDTYDTPHPIQKVVQEHWLWTLGSYFILGILLAFTPCVLPMLPIVAGIIIGEHTDHRSRGLALSLSYVLGMALAYASIGIVITRLGINLQAFWQQPWLIALFAGVFVLMALALFDRYQIRMPAPLQNKLTALSNQQSSGKVIGAFVMGVLSSFILSPCITPALIGALAYIMQSGNVLLGGSSLFSMGLGMGVPLIVIGLIGQQLLRHCGPWLAAVKTGLGILMLAVATALLSRIFPNWITQIIWGALFIASGAIIFPMREENNLMKLLKRVLGIGFVLYGVLLWSQLFLVDHPGSLPALQFSQQQQREFKTIHSPTELKQALTQAGSQPVLIDFTAKWCPTCQVMEQRVFPRPEVQQALVNLVLLKVDLTESTPGNQALMKQWNVIAPPVLAFVQNQQELIDKRIVGGAEAEELIKAASQ